MNRNRRFILTTTLSALAAALGFVLMEIPNVELISFTVFVSGLLLGPRGGFTVGVIGEGLYSALNPFASGLAIPPLFLAQILTFGLIGWLGGLFHAGWQKVPGPVYGVLGSLFALFYSVITALAMVYVSGIAQTGFWAYFTIGVPFLLIHMGVNFLVFTSFTGAAMKILNQRRITS